MTATATLLATDPATALFDGLAPAAAAAPVSRIVDLVNYGRTKAGLIGLWVGEGADPTPPFICDAAMQSIQAGETFYTWQRGIPELRDALARYHSRLFGVPVERDQCYVIGSGMASILIACRMILTADSEMVLAGPLWPNAFAACELVGAKPVGVELEVQDGRWQLDLDKLFAAVTPRTRAMFLNSPGNPTGWMMDQEQQRVVLEFCRQRGIWIIADEVYQRFSYDYPVAPSFLQIADRDDRLLVVNSFSKNWAMTGWRVGWMVAPPALGQVIENLVQYTTSGVAVFKQRACQAALDQGETYVQQLVKTCRTARDLVYDRLSAINGVEIIQPDGAFYHFFRHRAVSDCRQLAIKLVDEANVGLAPGQAFMPGGKGYLRLCFAQKLNRLTEALDRLEPALRKI
jgi:aspartate/methionine/tyrosine aminotransferase